MATLIQAFQKYGPKINLMEAADPKRFMELLTQLNKQGITVVLITHEPEVADYATRQIHFRDGRIESDQLNPDVGKKRAHGG